MKFVSCFDSFRPDQMRGTQDVLEISNHAARPCEEFWCEEHLKGTGRKKVEQGAQVEMSTCQVTSLTHVNSYQLASTRHTPPCPNIPQRGELRLSKAPTLSQQVMAASRRPGYRSQAGHCNNDLGRNMATHGETW